MITIKGIDPNMIAMGIEATFWLKIQTDFNLITAKRNPSFIERLKKVHKKVASVL